MKFSAVIPHDQFGKSTRFVCSLGCSFKLSFCRFFRGKEETFIKERGNLRAENK